MLGGGWGRLGAAVGKGGGQRRRRRVTWFDSPFSILELCRAKLPRAYFIFWCIVVKAGERLNHKDLPPGKRWLRVLGVLINRPKCSVSLLSLY